ncbi:hypothetical protein QCA50_016150 [Cerrena zonata]|uniref:Uncharacterized protein n=1 Tax=Cerrena zonata TaxID=2478898 RepID=A0AAW0FPF2_9APHY
MFGRNLLVLFPLLFLAVASPVPAEDKRSHGHGATIQIIDTSMLTGGRLTLDEVLGEARIAVVGN